MCGLPGNCTQLVAVACDDGHEKQVELFAKNSNAAAIASIVGRSERASEEGANGHFSPWKLGLRIKNSRKLKVRSLISINWFNSCLDSLFAAMTLIVHKIQVHYSFHIHRFQSHRRGEA